MFSKFEAMLRFRDWRKANQRHAKKRITQPLRLESLEDRRVPANFIGTEGNDNFNGTFDDDSALGLGGDDVLLGSFGNDTLDGGTGNDRLDGGDGNDQILGGDGNDTLGGSFGNDTIAGGTGDDRIDSGFDDDVVTGDAGNDTIRSSFGDDTISGGVGNDSIDAGFGDDQLEGNEDDDTLRAGFGDDTLSGGTGNDRLDGGFDDDALDGGQGDDTLIGNFGDDQLNGGAGDDRIDLGFDDDIGAGGDGQDTLIGNFGDDFLAGGAGDDSIDAGFDDDTIFGQGGVDEIRLNFGNDTLIYDGTSLNPPGSSPALTTDQIQDFSIDDDRFALVQDDFGVEGELAFVNAHAADLPQDGVNVIVLQDADDDGNPDTVFNARSAAQRIGEQITAAGAGFFVYFNSALGVNRLVHSENLADGEAAITVLNALNNLKGNRAIDALPTFTQDNFSFQGKIVIGDIDANTLNGDSRVNTLIGFGGNDTINGLGGVDEIVTGSGADDLIYDATALDSTPDQIRDFSVAEDRFVVDAADFGVADGLKFVNALAADLPDAGENVIVLQDADDDGDPNTVFNARSAARLIGAQVSEAKPGFFVYFNSALNLNRLVYTPDLSDGEVPLTILNALTDVTGQDAINALPTFSKENFAFRGEDLVGTADIDTLIGFGGDDIITGLQGADQVTTGGGSDALVYDGTSIGEGPDQISDFSVAEDRFVVDAADFRVASGLNFVNALAADLPDAGENVIVLQDADDDGDPNTVFNARSAARLIGAQITQEGSGFFVYFNSGLGVNRLVHSEDLSDGEAGFSVLNALNNLEGDAAINALPTFSEANFAFQGEELVGDGDGNTLTGFGGNDRIDGAGGDDTIVGQGGVDALTTGSGADALVYNGTSLGSGPDQITDFSIAEDRFQLNASAFGVTGNLAFVNALAENLPSSGVNVIVLQDADDDGNAGTVFNARSAARLIAGKITETGAGFFVYFNSALNLNRLVYTPDLSNGESPLTILNALTDLTGQAAIDALPTFTEENFEFI